MINSQSENTKRIAKNTLMLYVRMLFSMLVSLYTSRVVLNTLGVEDYGIYNVVGGVVALFSLMSGSLSSAVNRFLTFELGKDEPKRLSNIFSTSLQIHIGLAIIIFICIETLGIWFLNTKMVIPAERIYAANWLLQFSLFSFMIGLIGIPYNAAITSHEHFSIFAYIGIADTLFRLVIVLLLSWLPNAVDKLIIYSFLIFCVGVSFQLFNWWYCRSHFKECRLHISFNIKELKEIATFASWNFIGVSSAALREQGGSVLINLFGGGPMVNAARGIAGSVNGAVSSFTNNFMAAVNPQITKSYASGEYEYMTSLIFRSARFSYFLLLLLGLPILINTHYILYLWLKIIPDHVVEFTRLVIVFTMCESLSNPLVVAQLATGKIRNYQIVVGGLQMLNFPFSYMMLRLNFFPEIVMLIAIFLSLCCLGARLYMLHKMISLPACRFLKEVILKVIFVTGTAIILPIHFAIGKGETIVILMTSCVICQISTGLCIYYIGCNQNERVFIRNRIISFIHKIKK